MNKDFLSVLEFAKELQVHPNTIYKAIRKGRINAFRVSGGDKGAWRIPRAEITRIATLDFKLMKESSHDTQ